MKKRIICIISFVFCLITILTFFNNRLIQVDYDVRIADASGSFMSTSGFKVNANDVISARNIVIVIVVIIFLFFLSRILKSWDKRCYEKDPTAVANIDIKMTTGAKIFLTLFFVFIAILIFFNPGIIFSPIIFVVAASIDENVTRFVIYILGLKSAAAKNLVQRIIEVFIVISIIGILAAMSMPRHGSGGRWQARQKACYSNIRVLQGSVEMYNMDNVKMMETLDISLLEKWGYIKPGIKCPESNSFNYKSFGDLSSDGVIGCGDEPVGGNNNNMKKNHGTLSGSDPSKKQ